MTINEQSEAYDCVVYLELHNDLGFSAVFLGIPVCSAVAECKDKKSAKDYTLQTNIQE